MVRERSGIVQALRPIGSRGSYWDGEMNSGKPDNVRKSPENPIITKSQTTPQPHHANQMTSEDSPHRPPKGGDRANILQGRGAKALEERVPEVAPASSHWDGAVPGAAGEGMGRCGSPPP